MASFISAVQNGEMADEGGDTESQRKSDSKEMAEVSQKDAENDIDAKGVAEAQHKETQSDNDGE